MTRGNDLLGHRGVGIVSQMTRGAGMFRSPTAHSSDKHPIYITAADQKRALTAAIEWEIDGRSGQDYRR
jgi:hypothetical protein